MDNIVINSPKQSPTLSTMQIPAPSALKLVDITNIQQRKAAEYVDHVRSMKENNDGIVTSEDVDEAKSYEFNCHLYHEVPKLVTSLPIIQADALAAALLAPGSALNILLESKFNQIDSKFNQVIATQNEILGHSNRMEARMNLMDARMNIMDGRMTVYFNEMRARSHNSIASLVTHTLRSFAHIREDGSPVLPVPATFPTTVRELMNLTGNTLGELENYYNLPDLTGNNLTSARRERFRNFIGVGMISN